jgi:hypothetical protein
MVGVSGHPGKVEGDAPFRVLAIIAASRSGLFRNALAFMNETRQYPTLFSICLSS